LPGREYRARFVILATGAQDLEPLGGDLSSLRQKRLLAYCPVCDGYENANKNIGLIVNADTALKKALYFLSLSSRLTVFDVSSNLSNQCRSKLSKVGVVLHSGEIQSIRPRAQGLAIKLHKHGPVDVDVAYVELGVKVPAITRGRRRGNAYSQPTPKTVIA
jgi:thioredoxin reductase